MELQEGEREEHGVRFGIVQEGLCVLHVDKPKRKNALTVEMQILIGRIFRAAEKDTRVKVIVWHGGDFYSSGNDLGSFAKYAENPSLIVEGAQKSITHVMIPFFEAILDLTKPLVCLVKGGCVGMCFTSLVLGADFVYCSEDAYFKAPFISSFQSPEGASSLLFA